MFVATLRIPALDEESAATLIKTLTEVRTATRSSPIKGFVQTLLLRGSKKSAMIVTAWESRAAMQAFVSSDAGRSVQDRLSRAVKNSRVQYEEYRATWQGRFGEP